MTRLQQEIMRNNRYCHSSSHRRVVKEFEAQYISAYQDRIVDEFRNMLVEERFEGILDWEYQDMKILIMTDL